MQLYDLQRNKAAKLYKNNVSIYGSQKSRIRQNLTNFRHEMATERFLCSENAA